MASTGNKFAQAERGIACDRFEARLPPRSDSSGRERGAGLDVPSSSCYCYYPHCARREDRPGHLPPTRPPTLCNALIGPAHIHLQIRIQSQRFLNADTDPALPASTLSASASPTSPTYICLASPKTTPRSHGTPLNTRLACRREWACEEYSTASHANLT